MLLHGIMSTIAEFYSRNLATEVIKGLTQKAATGGTPARAPLGYLNVRKRDELGRDIRTVETDPERAQLVHWAFGAYASGNYSTISLREELIDRGLTTVPTPKRPAKAPCLSTIQQMLSNPYYKGEVHYRGACYDGTSSAAPHTPGRTSDAATTPTDAPDRQADPTSNVFQDASATTRRPYGPRHATAPAGVAAPTTTLREPGLVFVSVSASVACPTRTPLRQYPER
jgi:hypothetical protein